MKIINHHLGLPVICLDTSEPAGDLVRFITDQVSGHIVAVAVRRKWYQEPEGVAFADCTAFGQNVILVSRLDALKPLSQMPDVSVHLEASNDARQRTAITESGRLLGSVTDEAFDEATGEVTGYRLDVMMESGTGRTLYIPHSTFVTSSATVAILQDNVLDSARQSLEALFGGEAEDAGTRGRGDAGIPTEGLAASSGAWPGAEDVAYAAPAELTDTAPPAPPTPSAPPAPPTPSAPSAPSAPNPDTEAASLDAAAMEAAPVEPATIPTAATMAPPAAPPAPAPETLFEDMAADDVDPLAEAEEFAPIVGDEPPGFMALTEEAMAGEEATEEDAAAVDEEVRAKLEGHNRVMMALVRGKIGKPVTATVRDNDGNPIISEGETITEETAQSAARAQKLYELYISAQD